MSTITKRVISASGITGLTDHYAKMWKEINDGIIAGTPDTDNDQEAYRWVTAEQNAYVEGDLAASVKALDVNGISTTTIASTIFLNVVNAIDTHVRNITGVSANTVDTLLTNSGLNVSSYYDDVYYYGKGRHLSANNVYTEDEVILAAATVASSGVGTYVAGTDLGTGDGAAGKTGDAYNYCAAQLKYVVTSGIGGNDLILKLHVTQEDLTETTINVTIPDSATVGDSGDIGTSSDAFIAVTNIEIAGGDTDDGVIIKNIIERTITF